MELGVIHGIPRQTMTWKRRVQCEKCKYAFDVELEKDQNIVDYLKNNSCPKDGGTLQAELDENIL